MKAIYHQEPGVKNEFDVITDHKNGTVDLGRGDEIRIHKCPVSDEPKTGHCVLLKAKSDAPKKPTKAELKAKAKELRDAAQSAAEAAREAQAASEAAPEDVALADAAFAATEAAGAADLAATEAEAAAAK